MLRSDQTVLMGFSCEECGLSAELLQALVLGVFIDSKQDR
jgi:hypothetical protein